MSCGQIKTALPKAALRPPVAVLWLEAAFSLKPYGLENRGHKRAGDIWSSFSPLPPTASLSIFSPGPPPTLSLLTRTRVSPGALTWKVAMHTPLSRHHSVREPESAEIGFSQSGSQRGTFLPDSPKKQCFAHKVLLSNWKSGCTTLLISFYLPSLFTSPLP